MSRVFLFFKTRFENCRHFWRRQPVPREVIFGQGRSRWRQNLLKLLETAVKQNVKEPLKRTVSQKFLFVHIKHSWCGLLEYAKISCYCFWGLSCSWQIGFTINKWQLKGCDVVVKLGIKSFLLCFQVWCCAVQSKDRDMICPECLNLRVSAPRTHAMHERSKRMLNTYLSNHIAGGYNCLKLAFFCVRLLSLCALTDWPIYIYTSFINWINSVKYTYFLNAKQEYI